ncbi:50S ribosomal protein L23 [Candidatus Campbellbacteria bacterium CG22_combo_CG10-13_8_21_14_all_36_13]|uniref:Large ribosomal subunit protein uL23 n=1 Tax=Candidatus Campbellbacteria bacterium CG22_combo_CG10-13_8_21_14_all_36_13 TaxID=1974529 RepID=A0A2H0DZ30_9BACT|nr:MAG: 50S ribosomal protein L23 [Candidatus Campbellbacteria bacterium CG22_combo_CG10-13_8_21_14_all_36_13]
MSALFKKKEKEKDVNKVVEVASVVTTETNKVNSNDSSLRGKSFLIRPRITEKATDLQMSNNVYTFDVIKDANKKEIEKAIHALYGIVPEKVRVVMVPSKNIRTRNGGKGVKSGGKKAYVYLKNGDTIEFV